MRDVYSQEPYDCRLEWGPTGARAAAARGDLVIVVDVLSFSSTVTAGVGHGATVFPYPLRDQARAGAFARRVGAELRLGDSVGKTQRRALSPLSFTADDVGSRVVLCSPNGATCARRGCAAPALLAGCLLNATAVARAADRLRASAGGNVTVVPCGEVWRDPTRGDNRLRPCLEDYLGAGAILAELEGSRSPEAHVCVAAFEGAHATLEHLIWDCGSGRELRAIGYADDVRFSARLDALDGVPWLNGDRFEDLTAKPA